MSPSLLRPAALALVVTVSAVACGADDAITSSPTASPTETTSAAPEHATLSMPRLPYFTWAPITLAAEEGFFEDEGLTIEYIDANSSDSLLPTLITGDLDVWAGAPSYGMFNAVLDEHTTVAVVAGKGELGLGSDGCTPSGIIVGPDSTMELTADSVRGATFGSYPGTIISDWILHQFLSDLGLEDDDVEQTFVSPASLPDAIANGQIDMAFTSEPWITRIADGRLLTTTNDVVPSYVSGVIAFGPRLLVDEPELGDRFLRAYVRGLEQYNLGKTDRNVEVLAEATGQSAEELRAMCWTPMPADGSVPLDAMDEAIEWAVTKGLVNGPIDHTKWFDGSGLARIAG